MVETKELMRKVNKKSKEGKNLSNFVAWTVQQNRSESILLHRFVQHFSLFLSFFCCVARKIAEKLDMLHAHFSLASAWKKSGVALALGFPLLRAWFSNFMLTDHIIASPWLGVQSFEILSTLRVLYFRGRKLQNMISLCWVILTDLAADNPSSLVAGTMLWFLFKWQQANSCIQKWRGEMTSISFGPIT